MTDNPAVPAPRVTGPEFSGQGFSEQSVVTRNGRPAAVLIGYEDLAALEETLEILSDPDAMTDIQEARNEVVRGEVVEGVDAVRTLLSRL